MSKKSSLSIIFLTIFIDLIGFGLLIPILPAFASKDLLISDFGIGFLIAVYSFMQFLFNPIFGKLSDRIGRRPIILFSLLCTSTSYLIFSYANSFLVLLLSRILAGIGGSNVSVGQAYIADVTTLENRSKGMGLIGAAFGLGFVFGPMIGGLLSEYGYHIVGFVAASFSLIAFIFAFFLLKESVVHKQRNNSLKGFDIKYLKKIFSMPKVNILIPLFFVVIFSAANIYGTFALLGYKKYNFTDREIGYLFGIMGTIGAIIQGGFLRILSAKFKDTTLLLVGLASLSLGLGGIPYGQNFLGLSIIFSIQAIGTGILQPTIMSMISKATPNNEQGSVLGINQSFSALGRVLGPIWGGFTFDFIGFEFPFFTGSFFTFITIFVVLFWIKKQTKNYNDVKN